MLTQLLAGGCAQASWTMWECRSRILLAMAPSPKVQDIAVSIAIPCCSHFRSTAVGMCFAGKPIRALVRVCIEWCDVRYWCVIQLRHPRLNHELRMVVVCSYDGGRNRRAGSVTRGCVRHWLPTLIVIEATVQHENDRLLLASSKLPARPGFARAASVLLRRRHRSTSENTEHTGSYRVTPYRRDAAPSVVTPLDPLRLSATKSGYARDTVLEVGHE